MANNSIKGLTAKGVPPLPAFIFILRCVVLALSVGILVAAAYNLSLFGAYGVYLGGYTGPPGFMIFVVIMTLIVVGAVLAVERFAAQIYIRIAVIIAYALNIIFWLSGWAWSASVAALFLKGYCGFGGCYGPTTEEKKYGGSMAAAAALGAVNWVLMIVILVFYIKACMADPEGPGVTSSTNNAELGAVKHEASTTPVQQPYVPPQQQYQQQPYGQYPPQQQQPYPPQQQQQQQPYPA